MRVGNANFDDFLAYDLQENIQEQNPSFLIADATR